jgi:hypothetical protein
MAILFQIFSFFPYYTLVPSPFGLQPYYFIFGLLLYFKYIKFIKININLLIIFFLSLTFFLLTEIIAVDIYDAPYMYSTRSLYNYLAFSTLIPIYSYLIKSGNINFFYIIIIVIIVTAIGFIQLLIDPNFLNLFLPRVTGTLEFGRGVNGIAPEPTFYGIIGIYIYIMGFIISDKTIKICGVIIIFILSISSAAIIIFSLYYLIANIRNSLLKYILILVIGFLVLNFLKDTDHRIFYFINQLIDGNLDVFTEDVSSNLRIQSLYAPIIQSYDKFFVPGLYTMPKDIQGRILSGASTVIFEFGIFSILIFYYIYNSFKLFKSTLLLVLGSLCISTQLGFPLLLFVIALASNHLNETK